jgi:protein gp37
MADKSAIEWTDATWTPIRARNLATGKIGWHCEHATTGCEFCYAEGFNQRLGTGLPFKPGHRKDIEIFLDEDMLLAPLRWKKPRMVFVCSMTDLFADFVTDEWRDKMFAVMALAPQHTFQVLTKRAERMRQYIDAGRLPMGEPKRFVSIEDGERKRRGDYNFILPQQVWPLPNLWLGVSAERQQEADERIPHLLATPAAVRFLSAEPLLGPLSIATHLHDSDCDMQEHGAAGTCTCCEPREVSLDWVIVGGESGRNARPMHPGWARSLRDQCEAAGVSFFFKQWGEWQPYRHDASGVADVVAVNGALSRGVELKGGPDQGPRWCPVRRVGKKRGGRLLDGKEHNAFPGMRA